MALKKGFFGTGKYFIVSTLLSVTGIGLILFSFFFFKHARCEDTLNTAIAEKKFKIDDSYKGKRVAIYFIKNVSTCCRPLSGYEKLKDEKSSTIIFYVGDDFSKNDLDNFRDAFEIPIEYPILKMGDNKLFNLLKKCNYTTDNNENMLLVFKSDSFVELVRRF